MPATPEQVQDFRETMGVIARELVDPLNDSLVQLARVLTDPSPVVAIPGTKLVTQQVLVRADRGVVNLLPEDPTRLIAHVSYDDRSGPCSIAVAGSDQMNATTLGAVLLPGQSAGPLSLPYSGELWAACDDATGRQVMVTTVHR